MRSEIADAAKALGLSSDDLAPVRSPRYRPVLDRILETFTVYGTRGRDRTWLWEGFKGEAHAVGLPRPEGHLWLGRLVAPDERVWFMTEDRTGRKRDGRHWLFEGRSDAVVAVLGELFLFEYAVVAKDYGWLLCETHHNVLIAVGPSMVERLRRLEDADLPGTDAPAGT